MSTRPLPVCPPEASLARMPHAVDHSRRGVALVITLIMLSVTLVMAVAFLAISRRDRASVSTTTDATTARLAAESGLALAENQIIANAAANTNLYGYFLQVSTNYINPDGYNPNLLPGPANPLNVNYTHTINGTPLTAAEMAQNIANLQILPRAPVLLSSNEPFGRFYLDLNRDSAYEGSGLQPQFGPNGGYLHPDGTENNNPVNVVSNFMTGDPEWIGVLERPDLPHGPNNKFIARYAFLAQPIGNSLDFNYIHNEALNFNGSPSTPDTEAYFRNQGVGSWELNLASFLADLNTNIWDNGQSAIYFYGHSAFPNRGPAFQDAFSILTNRYAGNHQTLASAETLFSYHKNYTNFWYDNIDEYSDGPLQLSTRNIVETSATLDPTLQPWAGADNASRFYVIDDLLDTNKATGFATSLRNTYKFRSSYDRYTYYRMLDQIGLDSVPDTGKMNLNYDNVDNTTNFYGASAVLSSASVTNFLPWTPINFFTNAADRILRLYTKEWYQASPANYLKVYYGIQVNTNNPPDINGVGLTNIPYFGLTNQIPSFGVGNIPVIYNGNVVYSPAVNRLLQLAANLYDATGTNHYPSVFKPVFYRPPGNLPGNASGNISIGGYVSLSGYSVLLEGQPFVRDPVFRNITTFSGATNDFLDIKTNSDLTTLDGVNIYGVPWIIGAKKGFPNFNEFSLDNIVQFTRKLQVTRTNSIYPLLQPSTNEWLAVNFTNKFGIEFWNSYGTNYYSPNLGILVFDQISASLALPNGNVLHPPAPAPAFPITRFYSTAVSPSGGVWYSNKWSTTFTPAYNSAFLVPMTVTNAFLTNAAYSPLVGDFVGFDSLAAWPDISLLPLSPDQFILLTTNYLRSAILDNGHIIDYAQFEGLVSHTNLTLTFTSQAPNQGISADNKGTNMWSTLPDNHGTPLGIANQIDYSRSADLWSSLSTDNKKRADAFSLFTLGPSFVVPYTEYRSDPQVLAQLTNTTMQAPFTPTVTVRDYTTWQANDPLVHYLASDLTFRGQSLSGISPGVTVYHDYFGSTSGGTNDLPNLGQLNDRYAPWGTVGAAPTGTTSGNRNVLDPALQDPQVWTSDYWNFPTNKLPGVGWIGRIHRGTPWQTIYLKAADVLAERDVNNNVVGPLIWQNWTENPNLTDAANMEPKDDRWLFDLFTTAPNDNATRGLLSVNQTHLAAWSAVFGGMVALQNTNKVLRSGTIPSYGVTYINPAGVDATNSALWAIVNGPYGINQSRANTNLFNLSSFRHVGDILRVPALTDHSPFFNTNLVNGAGPNLTNGITDAAYEWLPEQAMSLLRLDSAPRYVIYVYGQALKPVTGAQVTSGGANFGLFTNYQVVAESAARAVVQVRPHVFVNNGISATNYTTTVESYNVLPPQ